MRKYYLGTRDWRDGRDVRVRDLKFEVFQTSNPELRTSDRAFLASHALHAPRPVVLADFFSILLKYSSLLLESLSPMSIQWFPGHMNTARKEAAKTMEVIDVVVEVLDARIPNASCNPLIEELRLTRQRPSLKVLNKADLADPAVTQAWLDLYNRQPGVSAVALSCHHAGDAAKLPQLCQPLAPHRNSSAKPLRMLIMGVPNVGKSTLMNMLLKRRIARVGDEPAVTKVQQRHKLNDHMAITDSPGLLWGTIKDPHVGLLLATVNADRPQGRR